MSDFLAPLLTRFAKLMLLRGVLFPAFVEAMKRAYLEAAQEGGTLTDSRVSVMTGLQRRDIARLRGASLPVSPKRNHLAVLVAQWQSRADYLQNGLPVILPQSGPEPSFDALARSIRQDVHPRTMLDTLIEAGTVTLTDGKVELVQTSYQPSAGTPEQLEYLAANVGDHLAAATENLAGRSVPLYERALHYSHLSPDAIAQIQTIYEQRQQELLVELNGIAAELQETATGYARFRAGGYFYTVTQEKDPS